MVTIVPASSDNSGIGFILGILLVAVLGVGAYFYFNHDRGSSTTINLPDVNVSAPATPGAK